MGCDLRLTTGRILWWQYHAAAISAWLGLGQYLSRSSGYALGLVMLATMSVLCLVADLVTQPENPS
jgi:hypothetical protein